MNAYTRAVLERGTCDADVRYAGLAPTSGLVRGRAARMRAQPLPALSELSSTSGRRSEGGNGDECYEGQEI